MKAVILAIFRKFTAVNRKFPGSPRTDNRAARGPHLGALAPGLTRCAGACAQARPTGRRALQSTLREGIMDLESSGQAAARRSTAAAPRLKSVVLNAALAVALMAGTAAHAQSPNAFGLPTGLENP